MRARSPGSSSRQSQRPVTASWARSPPSSASPRSAARRRQMAAARKRQASRRGSTTRRAISSTGRPEQIELPGLRNEVVAAPAGMPVAAAPAESGQLVNAARRLQLALRPEHQLAVPALPREPDALVDQALSDAQPARGGLDQEQPQLRHLLRLRDQEDGAHPLAVPLRDPATLARGVEMLHEGRHDLRHQRLEPLVVAVLLRIEHAMTEDDPAHVAGAMRPEQVRRLRRPTGLEHGLDRLHRPEQPDLSARWERAEQAPDLLVRARVELLEGGTPRAHQREGPPPPILAGFSVLDPAALLKPAQDAAQVPCVEP